VDTQLDEIADGIYRISTFLPAVGPDGFTVNQFLVVADEPLLFHTGLRAMFPSVVTAVARVLPVPRLRWVSFGHVEPDECGAVNLLLAVAPHAEVVYGPVEPDVALGFDDLCDRPVRPLGRQDEALDVGGRRIVAIPTPHVPHNRESQILFEETTRTLLCGDLFTQTGRLAPLTTVSPVGAAVDAQVRLGHAAPGPALATTVRQLAGLHPRTLAVMHGSSFEGDGATALTDLADAWDARFGPVGEGPEIPEIDPTATPTKETSP
jgi:glyoxylase-like metal-dependent hydrolase (beta-lactamase superfamily II)